MEAGIPSCVRFGAFEFDTRAGELRKNQRKILLQEQPFQILLMLVQRRADVLTFGEIQKLLWPDNTIVEFDHSIHTAINKLRQALGDSAERPKYIETVARRGYRFIAAVESCNEPAGTSTLFGPRRTAVMALGAAVLLALVVTIWVKTSQQHSQPLLRQRQITTNSGENAIINSAISPDGKYLVYADREGIYLKLLGSGDTQKLVEPVLAAGRWQFAWFPESTRFLASPDVVGSSHSIWTFSVIGGTPRKLRDDAYVLSISPDGSNVAFTTKTGPLGDREIWLMGPNSEQPRRLSQTDENSDFENLKWSPDGRRLAYMKHRQVSGHIESAIESIGLDGGTPMNMYSAEPQDFHWMSDGRMILSIFEPSPNQESCNFWALRVDTKTGGPRGQITRLTNWAGFCMDNLSATADGKRLAFHRWSMEASVWVAELEPGETHITTPHRLTATEGRNIPSAWTPDSQAVVFWSDRIGRWQLFKQAVNSEMAENIFTGSEDAILPEVSPDGAWVLYLVPPKRQGTGISELMRIPLTGGSPQPVLTARIYDRVRCAKFQSSFCAFAEGTPDGKQFVITAVDATKGRGRELAQMETEANAVYMWDLSPEGDRIGVLKRSEGRIRILSLTGGAEQTVTVKGWNNLQSLDWTADGRGFFLSSPLQGGSGLLHVDLLGNAVLLWRQGVDPSQTTVGLPSPDGRHLAMLDHQMQSSNIWMIEDF